ncbi:MAG: tryptophan--tRNA ligase, partial [candidate division WOR-3 bacterium]|nr:tryptophan--tRNA ligase [candidate division WOR-3 bacterium]
VFTYHKAFNQNNYLEIERDCRQGKIGCVACKEKLIEVLNQFLEPIRERRKYYEERKKEVLEILYEGTKKAKKIAEETLKEVRAAIKIDYFK